jgi:hypothetical protein
MSASAALILALKPSFAFAVGAEFLQGASAGLIGPAIVAISLGIVGRRAMSTRTGWNSASAGQATPSPPCQRVRSETIGASTIFLVAAALSIPPFSL